MAPLVTIKEPKAALGGACGALFVIGSGLSTLDVAALPYMVRVLALNFSAMDLTRSSPSVARLNGKSSA